MNRQAVYSAFWLGMYNKGGSSCTKSQKESALAILEKYLKRVKASSWNEATDEQIIHVLNSMLDDRVFIFPERVRNALEPQPWKKPEPAPEPKTEAKAPQAEPVKTPAPAPTQAELPAPSDDEWDALLNQVENELPAPEAPTVEAGEQAPSPAEPEDTQGRKEGSPFDFDPLDYTADYFLETVAREPEFIWHYKEGLKNAGSMQPRTQSVIFGGPGTGKSFFAIAGAVSLSAGVGWADAWYPDRPRKVLYLGAEDEDDVILRRVKGSLRAIPEEARHGIGDRFCAKSLRGFGSLNLFKGEGSDTQKTDLFNELFDFVERHGFEVVILDTLGCFMPFASTDDVGLGTAGAWIDAKCSKLNLAVVWIWHALKSVGQNASNGEELKKALSLSAMKFGPAFSGKIRWAMALTPLEKDYAGKIIGAEAKEVPSGTYIAARVVKKNEGAAEDTIYLRHDSETGILIRELGKDTGDLLTSPSRAPIRDIAKAIADEVRRRYEAGEKYLPKSAPWSCETFITAYEGRKMPSHSRWNEAMAFAIDEGMIGVAKNPKGNGVIIMCPDDPSYKKFVDPDVTPENISKPTLG